MTIANCGVRNKSAFARPGRDNRKLARHIVPGSSSKTKSVLKGRWNHRAFSIVAPRPVHFSHSPGTLSPANFRCRFAALRLLVLALNSFPPSSNPK